MTFSKPFLLGGWWERNLLLVGVGLSVAYWWLESALHVYVFREGNLTQQLLFPDAHELWMRLMVIVLLIIFSIYGQSIIDARKRVQGILVRREKEATGILENNPAGIMLVDAETRHISWVNSNALRLTGNTWDNIVGCFCHEHLCPAERGNCPVLDLGQSVDRSERTLINADGDEVPILKSVTKVTYQDRPHLLEAFFDITKQKKMRQEIKSAHAELDQIFQTASVGLRLIDRGFNILKVNETFTKMSGIAAADAEGQKCFHIFEGETCHTADCPLTQTLEGRAASEYQVEKTHADGTRIPCILRSTPFIGPDGDTIGIVESFQDITDLKHSQLELRAERDKLHRILFQQLECVSIFNADWEIEYQNEISKAIFSNAIGRKCYEVYHQRETPCTDCQMTRAIASGIIQRQEVDSAGLKSFEHTYTPFVDTDSCRKVVVSSRDITENRASRQAALSSERLAALGELAAGVAHEINNPINGIINYAQMVRNKYGDDGKISDISSRIVKEGNRIANIVESLLSFARREKDERMVTDLEAVLTDALTLTAAQLRKDAIAIDVDILGDLPPMVVNPQKIQQVFVNLISNARYALQQKADSPGNGLKLYISARALQTEGQPQIRVVFDDNGIGIPAEFIDKVLNPFFSTKPKGHGTGLGLSISHGIINDHGGSLAVESAEGDYTRITIDLPAAPDKEGRLAS